MTNHLFRRIVAPLSATALCVGLAACGADDSSDDRKDPAAVDQVLRWGSSSEPTSLDPRRSATFDPIFLTEVYDALVRRTAKGDLEPSLATKWAFSNDAKTLELTLREGVKFQDGAVFDAQAVKANIDEAKKAGYTTTGALSVVDSVEVVDSTHVTLTMSEPSSHMLNVLAGEAGMMISPDALDNKDLARNPVGTGPFKVTKYNQSKLVYEAWDGYWDADAIKLDKIDMTFLLDEEARLRAVSTGQVDAAPIRSNQKPEAESAKLRFTEGQAAYLYGVMLNTDRSELGNPLVRKALIHAIDREAINKAFFQGDCAPVVQPFPSSHWAHVDGLEESEAGEYDPDKARALLKEAGLTDAVTLQMYMGTAPTFQSVAQALQAQLDEVGITVKLKAMENTALATARRKGEFESSFASIQSGRPDPSQFAIDFYTPKGVFNPGGFSLDGVDDLLLQTRQKSEVQDRKGPMSDIITNVLQEGPPMIPVCSALVVWAHNDKVDGLEIAVNYDYDFRNVTMK